MHEKFKWIWHPTKKVGLFEFGCEIPRGIEDQLIKIDTEADDDSCGFDVIASEDGERLARINVDSQGVYSLECNKFLFYKSHNLLEMSLSQIKNLIPGVWVTDDEWETGYSLCNEKYGITLWIESNVVESITVGEAEL